MCVLQMAYNIYAYTQIDGACRLCRRRSSAVSRSAGAWHVTVLRGYSKGLKVAAKLLRAGRGTHCTAVWGPLECGLCGAALYIGYSRVLTRCCIGCTVSTAVAVVSAADAVGWAWAAPFHFLARTC
jgi:hypothetical protein